MAEFPDKAEPQLGAEEDVVKVGDWGVVLLYSLAEACLSLLFVICGGADAELEEAEEDEAAEDEVFVLLDATEDDDDDDVVLEGFDVELLLFVFLLFCVFLQRFKAASRSLASKYQTVMA